MRLQIVLPLYRLLAIKSIYFFAPPGLRLRLFWLLLLRGLLLLLVVHRRHHHRRGCFGCCFVRPRLLLLFWLLL
jgi:hypothetical protein